MSQTRVDPATYASLILPSFVRRSFALHFKMALQVNKVLISDSVDVSCREILEAAGIAVDYKPGMSKEDLLQSIKVSYCVQNQSA